MRRVEIAVGMLSGVFLGYSMACNIRLNPITCVVEVIGTIVPLTTCLSYESERRDAALGLLICFVAGLFFGSRLYVALSSAHVVCLAAPSWVAPLLMAATVVAKFIFLKRQHQISVSPAVESELVELRWQDALKTVGGYDKLSRREAEVLELTLAGKTTKEIGALLAIAPSTAGSYRARICEKLNVGTIQEVLAVVVACQLNSGRHMERVAPPAVSSRQPIYAAAVLLVSLFLYLLGRIVYWPYLVCMNAICAGLAACATAPFLRWSRITTAGTLGAISVGLLFPVLFYGDGIALPAIASILVLVASGLIRGTKPIYLLLLEVSSGLLFPGDGFLGSVARVPFVLLVFSSLILASAYLAKDLDEQKQAASALDLVATGEVRLMSYLMGRGLSDVKARIAILTAYGFENKAIAKALYVSTSTVSNYRSQIYSALELENSEALADLLKHDAGFAPLTPEEVDRSER